MTWTKLSDDFSDECWTLSDAAFRLLVEMLNYSNRKLLDCRIPKADLRRFAKNPEAADELAAGTWIADGGDVWIVTYHSLYQPSRERVIAIRDRNVKNGRKGGRPKNPSNPEQNPDGNPAGNPPGRDGTGLYTGASSNESESAIPNDDGHTLDHQSEDSLDAPERPRDEPIDDAPAFEKYVDERGRTRTRRVA